MLLHVARDLPSRAGARGPGYHGLKIDAEFLEWLLLIHYHPVLLSCPSATNRSAGRLLTNREAATLLGVGVPTF